MQDFEVLKRQELEKEIDEDIEKLSQASQTIYHWIQICEYHYLELAEIVDSPDLALERIGTYRRAGETVALRFVYEAHIAGFLQGLHAMIDSFPYLLNLFIPKYPNPEDRSIGWGKGFIQKYESESFSNELQDLWLHEEFQLLKGYVNTIKHKRIVRVANQYKDLEFESISYNRAHLDDSGNIVSSTAISPQTSVEQYLAKCHDILVPQLFSVCELVKASKRENLAQAQ